jgi:DNA polymerase-3 subunit beta
MKFKVDKKELVEALSKIKGIVPLKDISSKDSSRVSLDLEGNELYVTGTDSNIVIRIFLDVIGLEDGKVVVLFEDLLDTISDIPDIANIEFSTDSKLGLKLKAESEIYNIRGKDINNLVVPSLPYPTTEFTMLNNSLKEFFDQLVFAVGNDSLRPEYEGVLFHIKNQKLINVSTDGHRMVKIISKGTVFPKGEEKYVVPPKVLKYFKKFIGDSVTISFDKTNVRFCSDNAIIYSKLILPKFSWDSVYPDYESVIPTDYEKKVVVNRKEMLSKLKELNSRTKITKKGYKVSIAYDFLLQKNSLKISVLGIKTLSDTKILASCDMSCKYDGEDIEFCFNQKYTRDILNHLNSKEILIEFNEPERPFVFKELDVDDNKDVLMLLAPCTRDF